MKTSNDCPRPVSELIKEECGFTPLDSVGFDKASSVSGGQPIRETTVLSSVSFSFKPKHLSELNSEIGDVKWIWEGFLTKGHLTLLSALWKSGKTTLVSQLLKCIATQKLLAGKEVKQSKVLILSEESEALWARRREELSLEGDIWITSRPIKQKLNDKEWVALLKAAAGFCKQKTIDLFIVDTLSGFWAIDNENDAAKISSALLPINHLLEQNIAVLLIHHFRKSGGNEGTASRGSGALGSTADILVEFSRMDGDNPNSTQRVLKTYSRFEESPKEVVIELINGEYITRGTKTEVSKTEKLKKILILLPNQPNGVTITELFDNWDSDYEHKPSKRSLRRYIDELNKQGKAKIVGEKLVQKTMAPLYGRIVNEIGSGQNHENIARQDSALSTLPVLLPDNTLPTQTTISFSVR